MDSIYDRACFLSPVFSSSHPPPPFLRCRYNKQEGDFPGLREYNDYLEQVEDIGTARCRNRASAKIVSRSHLLWVLGILVLKQVSQMEIWRAVHKKIKYNYQKH